MNKKTRVLLLVICSLISYSSAVAEMSLGPGPQGDRDRYSPGEILVKFRSEYRTAARERYQKRYGIGVLNRFDSIGVDHLRLPENLTVEQALAIFRSDPEVIYAEPNHYRYADLLPAGELFPRLWGLHNTGQTVGDLTGTPDADIDAPEAWDISTGSAEVTVAVIDSGIDYSHPDLVGNIWSNPAEIPDNGLDDDGNGYIDDVRGWDFINGDNGPEAGDASGHGTHVSGTIAAGGAESSGMAGVSWNTRIMSLRTLDTYGSGTTVSAILAFEYANAMGVRIINCSWGGGYSQALKDIIDLSAALVVCAAGNSGANTDTAPHYPASYDSPNIVSVAATDSADELADFSNFGVGSVDIAAPGVSIFSCAPGRLTLWADDFNDVALGDWNSGGPNNDWGITAAESFSAPYSLCDSPDGNYSQRTNSWIRTPALDLEGRLNSRFEFRIRGSSEARYDFLTVEVSTDGSVWFWKPVKLSGIGIVNAISGTIEEWTEASVDLSAYDGMPGVYVRFAFVADWTNNYDGWYIDDVAVTAASTVYDGSEYRLMTGTSMAAPHVSGVAALLNSLAPGLSAIDLKSIITGSVDTSPALDGLVASGGRLNAANAASGLGGGSLTCPGDFDGDYDVDGGDLEAFVQDAGGLSLPDFITDFGRADCP